MRNPGRADSIAILLASMTAACAPDDGAQGDATAFTIGGGSSPTDAGATEASDTDDDGTGDNPTASSTASSTSPTTATTGDPTGDPTGEGGTCDFDMTAAIQLSVDVSWGGGLAVLAGAGAIDIWLLADLAPGGSDVAVTGRVCRIELPDFETGLLAGNETYGTMFPDAIWSSPTMPTVDAIATIASPDPGAALHLERGAVVLGGTMANPLDDAWPSDWHALSSVDHDGDGAPGVTAIAKTGGNYAYPRIEVLDSNARAQSLYLVSRTILEFDGTIDTCDAASGDASVTMENHNVGCATVGGGSCSDGQTTTLDNNLPEFIIDGGAFELVRLPDGAGCSDVFAALP